MIEQILSLPSLKPFPEKKPDVEQDDHGWFDKHNARMLDLFLKKEPKLIVELGSWVGKSTRYILSHAPDAMVIAVDHWEGSPEHKKNRKSMSLLPVLFDTFIVNCWDYQDRLFPLKSKTVDGLHEIKSAGLKPDLIYVDAGHDYRSVCSDMKTCLNLFPEAQITGDDWTWETVKKAVNVCSQEYNKKVITIGPAWYLEEHK